MLIPDNENKLLADGRYTRIVGMDEVGRGCLAGPVTVGAYVYSSIYPTISTVNDSKQLSANQRNNTAKALIESGAEYLIEYATASEIDSWGIAVVIANLMSRIVEKLDDGSTLFLIDGQFSQNFGDNSLKVVGGDGKYYSIGAASILAKVARDEQMTIYADEYPGFSFDKHKGYGTRQHIAELFDLGVTELHRRSFAPVGNIQKIYK